MTEKEIIEQKKKKESDKPDEVEPYKEEEFESFLALIEEGNIKSWTVLADALGVSRETINQWKNHSLAKQAYIKGLAHALEKMEESGKRDWRMWREKAKILGVKDEQVLGAPVGATKISYVIELEGGAKGE